MYIVVFQLLNELELHCKSRDGDSSSIEQFKSNWTSILLKVKNFLESHNDYLLPNDQETSPGMLISIFNNKYDIGSMWLINLSYCSLSHPFPCNNQENGNEYRYFDMFQVVSYMSISIYFLLLDAICGVLLERAHSSG